MTPDEIARRAELRGAQQVARLLAERRRELHPDAARVHALEREVADLRRLLVDVVRVLDVFAADARPSPASNGLRNGTRWLLDELGAT